MKNPLTMLLNKTIDWMSPRQAERLIHRLESKIGIGSGAGPGRSGETIVLEVLKQIPDRHRVIFDVGANQGQFAAEATSYLGKGCEYEIHCFEPSPTTFEMFVEKHGNQSRIIANNLGLGATSHKARLYMDSEGSGLASLTQRKLKHFGINHGAISQEIELTTLDAYCAEAGIDHIDLLKIDVEGHELDVLAGGTRMVESGNIRLVQFEFGGCNIDTRTFFQDFYFYFSDKGFALYRILPSRRLLYLPKYREQDEKYRTANYLAVNQSMELPVKYERAAA